MIFPTLVSSYDVLELKYCERCGGLLLRRRGEGQVYCRACVALASPLRPKPPQAATLPGTPGNAAEDALLAGAAGGAR